MLSFQLCCMQPWHCTGEYPPCGQTTPPPPPGAAGDKGSAAVVVVTEGASADPSLVLSSPPCLEEPGAGVPSLGSRGAQPLPPLPPYLLEDAGDHGRALLVEHLGEDLQARQDLVHLTADGQMEP